VRVGRYGPYLSRGDQTAPVPDGVAPDELTPAMADELLERGPEEGRALGTDPDTGLEITVREGRYGPYVQLGEHQEGSKKKPKRGGGRQAAEPLAERGAHPDNAATVKLLAGRYGPYVTDGTTNASLPKDADPAGVTLEQAVELLRARAAAGPAKRPARKAGGARKATKSAKGTRSTKKPS